MFLDQNVFFNFFFKFQHIDKHWPYMVEMEHTNLLILQRLILEYGAEKPSSYLQKCLCQKQSSTQESNPRNCKVIAFKA